MKKINDCYIEDCDIERATIRDMRAADMSWEDCGCEKIDKEEDDKYSQWKVPHYTEPMSYDEMFDCFTDFYSINYWDGNNSKTIIVENSEIYDMGDCKIIELENPNPAYYFMYKIVFENGDEVIVTQSNMSGSLSPFYETLEAIEK